MFPRLPVRQWVLSVPKRLRYFMQSAAAVLGMVLLFALVNLHRVRKKLMALKERQVWGKFKAEVRLKTA